MLMAYLETVYATCRPNHSGSRSSGGLSVSTCGLPLLRRCGVQARDSRNVPRTLMSCIKS